MTEAYNPDLNIFMMCAEVNRAAFADMPDGFSVRCLRTDELDLWKRMPFDGAETAAQLEYMSDYFNRVYKPREELFFKTCMVAADSEDRPVATCFAWKIYDRFTTIHWLKTLPLYENRGIGRALLSSVMRNMTRDDYPVYLHTQIGSFKAIKLYGDFGFNILKDAIVGQRRNDIERGLPILKRLLPSDYNNLRFCYAGQDFIENVATHRTNDF